MVGNLTDKLSNGDQMTEHDLLDTRFRTQMRALYRDRGIVPRPVGYGCPSLSRCRQTAERRCKGFITGNWPYVGAQYGRARVQGRELRVLFIAMERGGYFGPESEAFEDAQRKFRKATIDPGNAHMGGVSVLMHRLVDEEDPEEYALQFALTNAVKCSVNTGSMSPRPSSTMVSQCAGHLSSEIDCLRPQVIVTQGGHPAATVKRLLSLHGPTSVFRSPEGKKVELFVLPDRLVLCTPHPARLKGFKWKRRSIPKYFESALGAVREEAPRVDDVN